MTEAEHTLLHTLGLGRRTGDAWRNHFVGSTPEIVELVAAGLMEKVNDGGPLSGGDPVFRATAAGKARAREIHAREYPKLTRSQSRYREWLNADSGIRFGEWLKMGCDRAGFWGAS
jgi:hypothetical protein